MNKLLALSLGLALGGTAHATESITLVDALHGTKPITNETVVELPGLTETSQGLYPFLAASRAPKFDQAIADYLVNTLIAGSKSPASNNEFEARRAQAKMRMAAKAKARTMLINAALVQRISFMTPMTLNDYDFNQKRFPARPTYWGKPTPLYELARIYPRRSPNPGRGHHRLWMASFVLDRKPAGQARLFEALVVPEDKAPAVLRTLPKSRDVQVRVSAMILCGGALVKHDGGINDYVYLKYVSAEAVAPDGKLIPGTLFLSQERRKTVPNFPMKESAIHTETKAMMVEVQPVEKVRPVAEKIFTPYFK